MTAETTGAAGAHDTAQPDRGGPRVSGADVAANATDGPSEVAGSGPAFADGLWVDRIGTRRYVGHNSRGAQVLVGPAAAGAVFTPGELMKIALAGCSGMSADSALARRLGDDAGVSVHVSGPSDPAEVRYPALHEELVVDLSGLSPDEQARVETIVRRAIDRSCTVGRTLRQSTSVELTISSPAQPGAGHLPGADRASAAEAPQVSDAAAGA